MFFLILLLLVLLLLLTVCYFLLRKTSHPAFFTTEKSIQIEKDQGFLNGYDELPKEDYVLTSFDGYELHCTLIPHPNSKKVVIITHGHSYTKWGSIKYLKIFYQLGYNAVIYDNRGHGENKPYPVSMGYRESKDLMCVIHDTIRRFGSDCILGLHGESMGSAISLQSLSYHPPIQFIVSDCGYSDLNFFTKMYLHTKLHLPSFLVDISSLLCRILYGYRFSQISAMQNLTNNQVPICFIHGAADDFIDCCNAQRMYDTDPGYKELHLFPDAGHAQSYASNPELYAKIVAQFIHKIESECEQNECKNA